MKDATWEVQKAVVALFMAKLPEYPVYDLPEAETPFPYITIVDTDLNASSKNENRQKISLQVHLWSTYRGEKEVKTMKDRVLQTLVNNSLAVYLSASFHIPELFYSDSVGADEPEVGVKHRIVNYVVIVTEV